MCVWVGGGFLFLERVEDFGDERSLALGIGDARLGRERELLELAGWAGVLVHGVEHRCPQDLNGK